MSTEKTIKIQKNKILTYSVNKPGFKTVYGSVLVNENQNINVEMKNLNSESQPYQLGDRLFGISSFVDYFTPSGDYDKDSLKYILANQTAGSGLTNIQVVKATWLSKVEQELSVETPRGTSNTFTFIFDGSNWQLTGATTQSNVNLEDYGISYDGTAATGDVITVVETQYNKFAFFVLDANYRGNYAWGNSLIMPARYGSNPQNAGESATFYYNFAIQKLSITPMYRYCKNLGDFILTNNIKLNALIPTAFELKAIWNNRAVLDNCDPVIQGGTTAYNLTTWSFYGSVAWTCIDTTTGGSAYGVQSSGEFYGYGNGKNDQHGVVPVFEVPVM